MSSAATAPKPAAAPAAPPAPDASAQDWQALRATPATVVKAFKKPVVWTFLLKNVFST